MCSMNATIYDCMQMENSARVDLYKFDTTQHMCVYISCSVLNGLLDRVLTQPEPSRSRASCSGKEIMLDPAGKYDRYTCT